MSAQEHAGYQPIAELFREHTREDERIYAGLLRHDSIVSSRPIFYALAGRASCCRYSELHAGIADRSAAQREIIADLERHNVRAIVIWKFGWTHEVMDQRRARITAAVGDGGATFLDEYIAERSDPIAEYGE